MVYRLSREAEEDVIGIFLAGVEAFGLPQAEHYHNQIARSFRFPADNPMAPHERVEIEPPVRIHPVGSHLFVHQVDDHGDVLVIRVRHGHEDWQGAIVDQAAYSAP